ncbi:MAG: TA system VapC family ribonuclease toxin [Polaromonas sp.]
MKSADLLDVNVWLALAYPGHSHHKAAKNYWSTATAQPAFCRTSMQSFLRLLTQPAVMGPAVHTPEEAWAIYDAHLGSGRVLLLPEPASTETQMRRYNTRPGFHVRDWTGAWLASFAVTAGCRMVSFDSGFQQYDGLGFLLLQKK